MRLLWIVFLFLTVAKASTKNETTTTTDLNVSTNSSTSATSSTNNSTVSTSTSNTQPVISSAPQGQLNTENRSKGRWKYFENTCHRPDTTKIEQILYGYIVRGNHVVVLTKANKVFDHCGKTHPFKVISCSTSNPCLNEGKCETFNGGTPMQRIECRCKYGYTGSKCEEEMESRRVYTWVMWILIIIEVILVGLAMWRYIGQRYYKPRIPMKRFVELLKDSR